MNESDHVAYRGYQIAITRDNMRYTARVSRDGGLVSHDGRNSEVWASASCGSHDRAILVARHAIDTGLVQ